MYRQTVTQKKRERRDTDRKIEKEEIQTDKQTRTVMYRQTNRQRKRDTDRQIDKEREKEKIPKDKQTA